MAKSSLSYTTILKIFRLSMRWVNKLFLEDYTAARIAKGRFNDPKSKIISGAELRKRLGI